MDDEKALLIFKALSNEVRLKIVNMLKEPDENFQHQIESHQSEDYDGGVCVKNIREKIDLGQSTTSQYLSLLEESGLLEKRRSGQWTYYRRNEETIKAFEDYIGQRL